MENFASFFEKVAAVPHETYVVLDKSDNVLAKQLVQVLNHPQVVALYERLLALLSKYSHLIIPFIGLIVQLTISSYTRKWSLERVEKQEREGKRLLAEKQAQAEQEAAGARTPKAQTTATKTSSASPAKTSKGKKAKK